MATILFDVGNVLVLANTEITHLVLQDYGVPRERAETFFKNPEDRLFARGKITEQDYYKVLVEKYLRTDLTLQQVRHAHNHCIHSVDERVAALLQRLNRLYRVAIVTDTNAWQNQRVEKELIDLAAYSARVFRSDDPRIQMLKIDDGFFPYVCRELGIDPGEATLVDDSPEKIAKANEKGLHTLLYQNPAQLEADLETRELL